MVRLLEDAKVNLRHRAIALRDERERWQAKWSARSENLTLDWLISMKERWLNLNEQMDSLKADCKRITLDLESIMEDDEINLSQLERELEIEESNYRLLCNEKLTIHTKLMYYIHSYIVIAIK